MSRVAVSTNGGLITPLWELWAAGTDGLRTLSAEGKGFELVWGFPCQVVFFGLLPVLCSEAEGAVLDPVAYDQVPRARAMGSRDRNASKAWRLAALAALVFGSALTPEHAEGR